MGVKRNPTWLSRKHGASYLSPGPTKANQTTLCKNGAKWITPKTGFKTRKRTIQVIIIPWQKIQPRSTKEEADRHTRTHTTSSNQGGTKKTPPKKEPAASSTNEKKPKPKKTTQVTNRKRKKKTNGTCLCINQGAQKRTQERREKVTKEGRRTRREGYMEVWEGAAAKQSKAKRSEAAGVVDGPRGLHNNDNNTTTNINNNNNNSTSLYQRNNKAPGSSLVPPMTPIPCASRNPCRSAKPCALTGVYKIYLRRSPPSVFFFFFETASFPHLTRGIHSAVYHSILGTRQQNSIYSSSSSSSFLFFFASSPHSPRSPPFYFFYFFLFKLLSVSPNFE